ncbi:N(G),N(G)-dimethylarginine dimethylaminohydrolase 1-like [Tubulanus polymorphus]|uniref:N(G),N(G)-dimethylarginine dimethylaminohydrolase 1-like n=1 Tax=Tubulanus polymorphus TaxID=672921 RepID=UPI003DA38FCE
MAAFKYNFAIVSRIPNSYKDLHPEVNLEKARENLEQYVEVLRQLGIDVLELPADECHPECVNVDDTAVVINHTALMCNPVVHQRQGEVNLIRQTLRRELGMRIVELDDSKILLEGGDVIFTGKEIFVGLSDQTNMFGAIALATEFPEYPVSTVQLPHDYRLKDLISVVGIDILAVGSSETAQNVLMQIEKHASYGYQIIKVNEDHAASAQFINGTLVHLSDRQIPKSFGVFEYWIDFPRASIDMEELLKGNSTLPSIALLIGKVKNPKKIVSTLVD